MLLTKQFISMFGGVGFTQTKIEKDLTPDVSSSMLPRIGELVKSIIDSFVYLLLRCLSIISVYLSYCGHYLYTFTRLLLSYVLWITFVFA